MTVQVAVLEDEYPDLGTDRSDASEEMVAWFEKAVVGFAAIPLPGLQATMPEGEMMEVEVLLCSRETASEVFELDEHALGAHIITTPDSDPFDDEAACARAYRIIVVIDREEIAQRRDDLIDNYGSCVEEAETAEALTVFHELAHVALFASNSNRNSPAEVELQSDGGYLDHHIFDMSTSYGIRPLVIDGKERWSDTMDEAREDMEAWCEEMGRQWCWRLAQGGAGFYAAAGIDAQPEPELR